MDPRPPRTPERSGASAACKAVAESAGECPLVQLEGAWYTYDAGPRDAQDVHTATWALRDISLRVEQGEIVCIVGANGSGKSTLMRIMGALAYPQRGRAAIAGLSVDDTGDPALAAQIHRRCAMVFQNPDDQMVTSIVADDVAFGPENLGLPHAEIVQRVDEALACVDMSACAAMDPADLSGGQRQRVAIAGALAMRPELMLFDEATSMLDEQGRHDVAAIMEQLHARGITIVYTTQHMDEALRASRAIALDAGRIAFDGRPTELFGRADLLRSLRLEAPFPFRLREALCERLPRSANLPSCGDMRELADAVAVLLGAHASPAPPATPVTATPSFPDAAAPCPIVFREVSVSYAASPTRHHRAQRRDEPSPAPDAVHDLSFSVARGTITALVGHTGSGKTTTAKLACGLLAPRAGTVHIAGIDTADAARQRELRAHVGYVSQFPERQLFAATVFDDVAFGPRNLGLSEPEVKTRVQQALDAVGLAVQPQLLKRAPHALSGGQQRAVALAGIIAMNCPVLVLDEPMAGLDPTGKQHMRALLGKLKRASTTILLVTHDMDDAALLADDILVLSDGRLVAHGAPHEVFGASSAHNAALPGIPHALAFSHLLAAAGAPTQRDALTLDELVEEVARGAQG